MGCCTWLPYLNKWITFVASILVAFNCGLAYTFALWAGELKNTFGLDQEQLQMVAAALNIGGYGSVLSGIAYDALLPYKKAGPRLVLVVGGVLNALGYLGLWAAVQGLFAARLWHLVTLAALAANGGTWGDTAVLVTNVRNFPSSRGTVVGILKASIGLSGSLFASVYSGVFRPDKRGFLLFLALAPLAVSLLGLPFINTCTFVQASELDAGQHVFTTEGRFIFSLQALGTLAVYLILTATIEALHPLSRGIRLAVMSGSLLLLLPLLLVPVGSGGLLSKKAPVDYSHLANYEDEDEDEEEQGARGQQQQAAALATRRSAGGGGAAKRGLAQPLLAPASESTRWDAAAGEGRQPGSAHGASSRRAAAAPAPGAATVPPLPDMTPWQCLRSGTFWLLFAILVVGLGAGLTLLNNLAQLVHALTRGASAANATPVLVSLFSVANCSGRMALGYAPERLLHSRGTPRLAFLPAMSGLMAAACLGLALCDADQLYPLAALAGFAFGGHWSLFPALVSELFGLTRFAANYTLVQMAPALGSLTLAMGLAGHLYERAVARHGGGTTCIGQDCFQATFLILSGLGALATMGSVLLFRRHRGLYRWHATELATYDEEVQREGGQPGGV